MLLPLATHPVMLRWEIVGNHLSNQNLFDFASRDSRSKKKTKYALKSMAVSFHNMIN